LNDRGELLAALVLRGLPGVGPGRFRQVVETFGSASSALSAPPGLLPPIIGGRASAALADAHRRHRAQALLEECRRLDMGVTSFGQVDYPSRLHDLDDPPPVVFWRGRLDILKGAPVAVVGSRRATAYGRRVARRLGGFLASQGRPVVSGMAMGVDAEAHAGALPGPTVAVLGSGADVPSPRSNEGLYRRILQDGLILSTFDPGTRAAAHHFPARNRVIAALSEEIVVVEATDRSGALITAGVGLDLGREIHAVPGPIDRPTSAGTNRLIADGAVPLIHLDDPRASLRQRTHGGPEDTALRNLWARMPDGAVSFDELVDALGKPADRVSATLTRLELLGYVHVTPDGRFIRSSRDP